MEQLDKPLPVEVTVAALEHLEGLGLDEETRELFRYGNASRVFAL